MSKYQRRNLKMAMINEATGTSLLEIGASVPSYDGAKIEILDEDGDEAPILPQTETWGTSTTASRIYCIKPGEDPEGEWVQGLMGNKMIDHEQQGVRGTTYIDLVEMLGGLAVFHGRAAACIAGLI
jgi:hypothetical protein